MELARENFPLFRADARTYDEVCNGFVPFRDGDVLIAKITPCFQNGKGGICRNLTNGVGFGSTEFHVLRPSSQVSAGFLYYATICKPFRDVGVKQMQGSAGQQRVPVDYLANFVLPYPPLKEQAAIVRFLDHVDRRIRRYIRAKRQLIALLNEQKQLVIDRAVAHGVEPNASYKPSGVNWLGDIPERWEIVPHKSNMCRIVDCPHDTPAYLETGEYPIIGTAEVGRGWVRIELAKRVSAETYEQRTRRLTPEAGDILYSREGGRFGMAGLVPANSQPCLGQRMMLFRVRRGYDPRYFMWLMNCTWFFQRMKESMVGSAAPRINIPTVVNVRVPRPPKAEQVAIADRISEETARIDHLAITVNEQVKLVREYQTRLIADAVTGKLDVREAAARLPDEQDEPDAADDLQLEGVEIADDAEIDAMAEEVDV